MNRKRHITRFLTVPMALAAMMLPGGEPNPVYAAEKGAMSASPHKMEITIRDREHGYETVGLTTPSADTTIVVRNQDTVTHGFASTLFKEVPVRMEGEGTEVRGKTLKSYHVDPGKAMTLHFSTMPSKFDTVTGIAETARYVIWCDIHPEVKGELYIIETKGEIGGG
ncbi:MAG: hypothetical protein HY581_05800 [Nitrospirae bacterium]|nr:hypothetical protein [Nitrospirota bacterium]